MATKTSPKPKAKKAAPKKLIKTENVVSPRKRRRAQYRSFRPSKRIRHQGTTLTGSFRLLKRALGHIRRHWRLFTGILLIYAVLNLLLVHGLSNGVDLQSSKEALNTFFTGGWGRLSSSLALFGVLVGSSGTTSSEVAGVYQSFLLIIVSLALVWALRQTYADKKERLRARDAFYKGLYPLVPFVLVLMVIGLQLVPMLIGGVLYGAVAGAGLAVTVIEKAMWLLILFLLSLLSLYMISSSIFALYIVTLPDMTPMQALRSARELVLYRRWTLLRKILFLMLATLLLAAVVTIPVIVILAGLAQWVFFAFGIFALAIVHSYLYALYRELL